MPLYPQSPGCLPVPSPKRNLANFYVPWPVGQLSGQELGDPNVLSTVVSSIRAGDILAARLGNLLVLARSSMCQVAPHLTLKTRPCVYRFTRFHFVDVGSCFSSSSITHVM